MPRAKPTFLCWVVVLILAAPTPRGRCQAEGESRMPTRYQVTAWGDTEGLPQNSVFAVARTPDGYMWLGTVEGLVRFDGVRFTVFDTGNTPTLGNNHVTALVVDHAGVLWIGTAGGGLVRCRDGAFTGFTTRDGLSDNYVTCLCEGRDGVLWVGTFTHGLNRWKDGSWAPATPELVRGNVTALAMDGGGLWVGTNEGVFRLHGSTATAYPPPAGSADQRISALCCDGTGGLWVGTFLGLQRLVDDRLVPVELGVERGSTHVMTIEEARDGTLWIGLNDAVLCRRTDASFEPCRVQGELPKTPARVIREDPEGNVWIGTDGAGLLRLRHALFGVYSTRDGLSSNFVRAVFQDAAGVWWAGTAGGVDRWQDGRFVHVAAGGGSSVTTITQDAGGALWVGAPGPSRACRLDSARPDPLAVLELPSVLTSLANRRTGEVWLGGSRGLYRLSASGEIRPWEKADKVTSAYVVSLFEDRAGAVWIGTVDNGISRYQNGRFTTWTTADGLASNHVLSFHEAADGALWIGTHGGGLCRFKDGRFSTVTTREGLYDNLAFAVLEDGAGNFWMSGNKGVYRARRQDLEACADGRTFHVDSVAYGAADGMVSRECNGGAPASWKGQDGTLWFPTIAGLAVMNPARFSPPPPRPVIEAVTVDHAAHAVDRAVEIRPGQRDLEVQYTALSWAQPERVRFQYQLAGLDGDWRDVVTRRTADFSHLPPGEYAFRVRADAGDGAWSEAANVAVVVLPPFWRAGWFLALAALCVVALVGGGFRWRGRQLQRRFALQQEFSRRLIAAHESERRRIAAELHDSLGQTLAMIKNSAVSGTRHARNLAAAQAQMEQITQQSTHAIGEVREIAYNLRPYLLDRLGLTKALRSMLHKIEDSSGLAITAELDPIDGRFSPEAEMSLYRIVQESFNNVLKHAQAQRVFVRIETTPSSIDLTIRDDGRGFDATMLTQEERRGFGLLGIAERVRLLGGTCTLQSKPGAGTTVSIHLPLSTPAYTPP